MFYCKSSGADGIGEYTTEGFVVLKGSRGRTENVASIQGTSQERFRNQLVVEGILTEIDGMYVFSRDHLFASPSSAAGALLGRSTNGWVEWKTAQGKTLDQVKRQAIQ